MLARVGVGRPKHLANRAMALSQTLQRLDSNHASGTPLNRTAPGKWRCRLLNGLAPAFDQAGLLELFQVEIDARSRSAVQRLRRTAVRTGNHQHRHDSKPGLVGDCSSECLISSIRRSIVQAHLIEPFPAGGANEAFGWIIIGSPRAGQEAAPFRGPTDCFAHLLC